MKFIVLILLAAVVAAEQKREAEPHVGFVRPSFAYRSGFGVPRSFVHVHGLGKRSVAPEAPSAHLVAKRAAAPEAAADPHFGFGGFNPYGFGFRPFAYGYGYGVPGGFVRVHALGKREAAHEVTKREAAASPEPHFRTFGFGLNNPYGFGVYRPFRLYRPFGLGYYGW